MVKWSTLTYNKKEGVLALQTWGINDNEMIMPLWRFSLQEQSLWKAVISEKYKVEAVGLLNQWLLFMGWVYGRILELFMSNIGFKWGMKANCFLGKWVDRSCSFGRFISRFLQTHLMPDSSSGAIREPDGWNFNFRRYLNDWELGRLAKFMGVLEPFHGLGNGQEADMEIT